MRSLLLAIGFLALLAPHAEGAITVPPVSVAEDSGLATFTVVFQPPVPPGGTTISYSTDPPGGTAEANVDYVSVAGDLTLVEGTASTTIAIPLVPDGIFERNETFTLTVSEAGGPPVVATATITDLADLPTLTVSPVTVAEGGIASFLVIRGGQTLFPTSFTAATVSGTATGVPLGSLNGDYTTVGPARFTMPADIPFTTIPVTTLNDAVFEGTESFSLNLSAATDGRIVTPTALGTITDLLDQPKFAIADVTFAEGGAPAAFTITKTGATTQPASVNFTTANGTAVAGTATAPGDFAATSGTLPFAPTVASLVVPVTIVNDGVNEPAETFVVNLSLPVGATIADTQGLGRITDNDPTTLAVNDVVVTEGDAGAVTATFSVSLSVPTSGTISAGFTTADGTPADLAATAPADYIAIPAGRAVRFSGAADTAPKPVAVSIQGDTLDEVDENFRILLANPTLTATGVVTTDLLGIGTIIDNDPSPTLTVKDVAVPEGNAGTTTVTLTASLSAASGRTVSAAWTTGASGLGVDATAGVDYVPASGTLTYAPGETSKTLQVTFNGDTTPEGSETVGIVFSQLAGAALLPPPQDVGFFVIADDDQFPVSPFPNADTLTVPQDTPGTVNVLANDVDSNGDFIFVSDNTAPAHGTVTCTRPGACTYTPAPGYAGPDSFRYTVSDGTLAAPATGTVTITVGKVNKPPTANADRIATVRGVAVTVRVLANDTDVDGDSLTVTAATQPANGTVTCSPAGVCRYTPKAKFLKGTNTFTYTVTDGALSSTGTVTVGVRARKALVLSATATKRRAKSGARNGYAIAIANPNPVGVGLRTLTACLPAGFTVAGRIGGDIKTTPKRSSCGTGRVLLTWKIRVTVPGTGRLVVQVPVRVAGPAGNVRITLRGAAAPGFTTNTPPPAAPILVAIS